VVFQALLVNGGVVRDSPCFYRHSIFNFYCWCKDRNFCCLCESAISSLQPMIFYC